MNKCHNDLQNLESYHSLLPEYMLPIVENLDLTKIIMLREEEQEAFNKYRIALNTAVKAQIKTDNQSDWKKIYDDIIFPELDNLDMKLRQLKRGRWGHIFGNMGIVVSVIVGSSFGDAFSLGILTQAVVASSVVATTTGLNFVFNNITISKLIYKKMITSFYRNSSLNKGNYILMRIIHILRFYSGENQAHAKKNF